MKTREEVAKKVLNLLEKGTKSPKRAIHFGKCELRDLLDYIYGGPPSKKEEEI